MPALFCEAPARTIVDRGWAKKRPVAILANGSACLSTIILPGQESAARQNEPGRRLKSFYLVQVGLNVRLGIVR
jgi:hypothetical protein